MLDHVWIPLRDGTRLGARIWLPEGAEQNPVPAIFEFLPYRKDDAMARRDARQYPYLAGHGYACVRVDIRGTGSSDGILYDEYLRQEQDDALEVLAWIASQPWCTGAVGMVGISWSGFNSLQVAARRPPQLKAVITVCSTDDRYADDVHYMGGCVLAYDMLPWASTMLAFNALPPDPRYVGARWREQWLDRLQQTPAYVEAWLAHQRRDAYWKHGSVCEDYSAIQTPVYAVGGWADGYTNAVFRLLAGLKCPSKGLIGPWAHSFPWDAAPGPSIGFLQESLRWWDHWLKGRDTGIMDEPRLRVWLQHSVPPATYYAERPGRWVAEPGWPSPNLVPQRLWPAAPGALLRAAPEPAEVQHRGSLVAALDSGVWCAYGGPGEFPGDQRGDDGRALAFTSAPAEQDVEILGFPELTLEMASDRPQALLAVRLCDVAPTGESTLVTWGFLNLTHRDSHEFPTPLEPGRRYTVTVRLDAIAHRLPAGHCWRVAVTTDYWPLVWPSPEPVTLRVSLGPGTCLALPVRPAHLASADAALPAFGPPEYAPSLPTQPLRSGARERTWQRDLASGRLQLTSLSDEGGFRLVDSGIELDSRLVDSYSILENDPLSATVRSQWQISLRRDSWHVRIETDSTMTADAECFRVTNQLDAYEGEVRVFARRWSFSTPRQGV